MTRYVCSWCGRKQEGVNLAKCEECPGPLNPLYDPGAALRAAQAKLLKAAKYHEPVTHSNPRFARRPAAPVVHDTGPLPPPQPRKPKPLTVRKLTDR